MFLPENIDLAQSEKYNLSIRLMPNGFSFCIYSFLDKSVFHYHKVNFSKNLSYEENLKKIFFEVNFFTQPFRKTTVISVSPHYTLIPDAYFNKKKAKDIFEFNIHKNTGEILCDYMEEHDIHIIHDMDNNVHSFLSRTLWNPSFESFVKSLMVFFNKHQAETTSKRLFVDFHDNFISVFSYLKHNLLSANTFKNTHSVDAVYYIASVAEKISMDQNNDWLFLSGNLTENKESIDILKSLIKNTADIEIDSQLNVPEGLKNEIPGDILISLCEL